MRTKTLLVLLVALVLSFGFSDAKFQKWEKPINRGFQVPSGSVKLHELS